ncbi:MAG: hypothetical protein EOO38_26250 [Cytophagaceae bacterium]|nr:MAG: hypothetical protein EOO38_26250 [Cytophagaceae bacterium]
MTQALEIQNKKDQEQLAIDEQKLQDHFKKNNIKVSKSPLGMYVEVQQEGTGNLLDTSNIAVVNYTGRTLDGKVFDSNTDPSFNHPEPFYVNLTNDPSLGQGVITGWKDGLLMMKKGSKGKFYIPSNLAYGSRGAGNEIPPYSVLIFDIEVVDALNREQGRIRMEEEMKKRREAIQLQQIQSQVQQQMQEQIRRCGAVLDGVVAAHAQVVQRRQFHLDRVRGARFQHIIIGCGRLAALDQGAGIGHLLAVAGDVEQRRGQAIEGRACLEHVLRGGRGIGQGDLDHDVVAGAEGGLFRLDGHFHAVRPCMRADGDAQCCDTKCGLPDAVQAHVFLRRCLSWPGWPFFDKFSQET